ncbi:MAG TPA: hypothetical protein VHM26_19110 [Chitinophagaceae bacterium]|jgi:hypothetical protein|nr:hypothetical protein [Chitinophagaceae bacterium]
MKHSFSLLLIAFVILAGSCSKNNDSPAPGNTGSNSARVKTYVGSWSQQSYEYDSKGRIVKESWATGEHEDYVWNNDNTITRTEYASDNSVVSVGTFELNADGLITKKTYSNNDEVVVYFYNPDKTIAKRTNTNNGNTGVIDYFYTNGNFDSSRYSYNGTWNSTYTATYYDKTDVLSDENFGFVFYGKSNKKLIKSEKTHYSNNVDIMWNYTYEFDGQGRVTKRTSTQDQDVYIDLYTY